MNEQLVGALVLAVVCGALALLAPTVIRRLPEPEPAASTEPDERGEDDAPPDADLLAPSGEEAAREAEEQKELYADMAQVRGLGAGIAVASAVVGALVGWRLGWSPSLVPWAYFVPMAVMLAVIDWRVRLLPTRVIAPSYGILVALLLVAAIPGGHWGALIGAAIGWAIFGILYFLLWFVHPGGLGYGDVRLSGLIGIVLGCIGLEEVLGALVAGSLLGGIGALALRVVSGQKYVPYGPFMLLGSLVGLLSGPWLRSLGY